MKSGKKYTPPSIKRAYWAYRSVGALAAMKELLPANLFGDGLWLILNYKESFKRFPNILRPQQFNEHLLRLMISPDGRSKLRARISDKEHVKEFVHQKIGDGFTARTIEILRTREDALRYPYPETCVIKATHASGKTVFRNGGNPSVDLDEIGTWFDIDYSEHCREPNYRGLEPKVIVEEFLSEDGIGIPVDYKIFCFQGRPAFIQVDTNRFSGHLRNYFSPNWRELDFQVIHPRSEIPIARPKKLEQMLNAAAALSDNFSFIRVDFYQLRESFYIGELTNFPGGALEGFVPESAGFLAGRLFVEPALDVESLFGIRPDSSPRVTALRVDGALDIQRMHAD